jgi:hypothetical protein
MENTQTKAEIFYERHLERLRNYNKEHADVIRARSRKQFQDIKADPEKYKEYLEKKREKYHIKQMDTELEKFHKSNAALDLLIGDLSMKIDELQVSVKAKRMQAKTLENTIETCI